jgi:peptidoglycan/LPS O-acetylase OafA/YrhL
MSEQRVYFHGLNELRACAALSVLFAHVELYKSRDGRPSLYTTPLDYFIGHLGENGVYLFFVLSGFLITFLLLEESARSGTIALRLFYLRRILRIWPLYYVIVGVGFGLVPLLAGLDVFRTEAYYSLKIDQLRYGTNLVLHLTLLSNLALLLFPPVACASQSWSVSVEEQFYLVWPILLKSARNRPLLMLFSVLLFKLALTLCLLRLANHYRGSGRVGVSLTTAARFAQQLKIELMAIGGIAAVSLRRYRPRIGDWLSRPWVHRTLLGAIAFQVLVRGHYLTLGVCFALLILYVVTTEFKNHLLDRLGVVSYGIYMYHPLAMFVGFALINNYLPIEGAAYHVATYLLVIAITLLLSSVSFRFLESPLLRLKARVSPVPSGGQVSSDLIISAAAARADSGP